MKKLKKYFHLPVMIVIIIYETLKLYKRQPSEFILTDPGEYSDEMVDYLNEKYDRHFTPLSILFWLMIGVIIWLIL